jgi:hypothetical protein
MINRTATVYILLIISAIFGLGLRLSSLSTHADPNSHLVKAKPTNITKGTCDQLVADDGKKYELIGKFPKIYDRKVRVSGSIDPDIITICQVGQPLKVEKIVKLINN